MSGKVRIGIAGTSRWADAMYLPALASHPLADLRGIVGGSRPEHTREFAAKWGIPGAFDSLEDMLAAEQLDALLVLTNNKTHYPLVMQAIEAGLHVLCEKPLGLHAREAREMAEAAERRGLTTMVPFTYRFMPTNRYAKELVDTGWLGRPHHLNMRYYTGYGRSGDYMWRFDVGEAGSGVSGDLGAHWVYLARWFFGEIDAVTAVYTHLVPRAPRPDGVPFEAADDSALMILEFANGATGSLHVTSLASSRASSASGTRSTCTAPAARCTSSTTGSTRRPSWARNPGRARPTRSRSRTGSGTVPVATPSTTPTAMSSAARTPCSAPG